MNTEQALQHLGTSTYQAVEGILRMFSADGVTGGEVTVVPPSQSPFSEVTWPVIAADVSYVDGVTGGNVLVIGVEGARRLAAAMTGADPVEAAPDTELSELEFSAVGEAMNQMMSAAAMATGQVLGEDVEIAPPVVRRLEALEEVGQDWEHPGHATAAAFSFCGAPCLLVQLVPNAFIVRMTRALDEQTHVHHGDAPLGDALRDVQVRVWAELGRTRMPSGRVVELPGGAVVELDREVDDPIDVYADGMRFATGRLLVTDDGGLAIRIEQVLTPAIAGDASAAADPPAAADSPAPADASAPADPSSPASSPDPTPTEVPV